MTYKESRKRLNPQVKHFFEFNEITEEDFEEGSSLAERMEALQRERDPILLDDFYGLQSSCLIPDNVYYKKLK